MDFPFDLNALFPERISVLDNNLTAGRKAHGRPDPQLQIATVIDELGKASAKAQQLPAPITSAAKLQANRHHVYLLKDGEQNGGRGVVVGFLKVGYKKLFLLDQRGAHLETEPLCVLDFYVTETLQRHGYGLELFDFMLKHKRVEPEQMAYDRPSPKFLSFLEKHYDLRNSVPQVNNFVVFGGFFKSRSEQPPIVSVLARRALDRNSSSFDSSSISEIKAVQLRKVPPKKPEGEIKPYSLMEREVVREEQRALPWPFVHPAGPPHSPPLLPSSPQSRSLSVGSSPSRAPLRSATGPGLQQGQTTSSQLSDNYRAKRTSHQGLVARSTLYSRHINSRDLGQLLAEQQSTLKLPGLKPELCERVCDTGTKADAVEHKNTSERPQLQGKVVSLPKPAGPKKDHQQGQTSIAPLEQKEELSSDLKTKASENSLGIGRELRAGLEDRKKDGTAEIERGRGRGGWSWTVGESRYTAQWVRQKQEYRSTRPW
ncbi:alpha-tubulin N-acetyltransferase 1-like isoform X2 [Myxocyprinus asiaticus]|uniref:alpha-tubulin N-acetyltransferase 1-like isoform X2 n=1 Tax=Myxocyprinus asiaticus TaxID=70543 RepID=UPI00222136D8|nr:alpha-tubulin N-acetyltransferase 1-like isoform X2 [Myxocyprinus asiaticus]